MCYDNVLGHAVMAYQSIAGESLQKTTKKSLFTGGSHE
jgi:hypothetical protein